MLRDQVIKLAHEHPELRQHLVPLLQKTAGTKLKLVKQINPTDHKGEIVVYGNDAALTHYAKANKLRWKANNNIFGGYWVDNDGNAYLIDVASSRDFVGDMTPIPGGV